MNKRLAGLLAGVFGLREAEVTPALTRDDVGTWDSLRQMELVITLEREYGIALEIPDIISMVTVAAIIDVLKAKGADLGD